MTLKNVMRNFTFYQNVFNSIQLYIYLYEEIVHCFTYIFQKLSAADVMYVEDVLRISTLEQQMILNDGTTIWKKEDHDGPR